MGPASKLKFGAYELHLRDAELRKGGSLLRLKPQPFRVLATLAQNAGSVVTREELREQIWGAETFVDFERGLNSCITQIRSVLNDDADSPRYIETLPRRGYRFIAQVEHVNGVPAPLLSEAGAAADAGLSIGSNPARPSKQNLFLAGGAAVAVILLAIFLVPRWKERPIAPPQPAGRTMLAVLPFQNLSGDPSQEFFGDGMTEEMIAVLGGLQPERLGVIARTSAMRYKATNKRAGEIAQELGVAFLVEGSVRREGDRARVTAQLIRASDESHIWAQSYERPMGNVIEVQREVAQQIARALAIELAPESAAVLAEKSAVDPAVYDAYLQGRFYWNQMTGPGFESAVKHFEQAIAADPKYAIAYSGLADAYNMQPWWGMAMPRVAMEKARAAAEKALALAPDLAEAHNSLGFVQLYYDWDLPGAERSFRRAIELKPGYALAHYWYAGMLSAAGRHEEAIASIQRAQKLDPYSPMVNADAGWYYFFARRYDEAIETCRRTIPMMPKFGWTYQCIFEAQLQKKDWAGAVETNRRRMEMNGAPKELIQSTLADDPRETLRRMRDVFLANVNRRPPQGARAPVYNTHFVPALIFAGMGDKEKAFQELQRAFEQRDSSIVQLKVDPRFDGLRGDPRFAELVRKARL